MAVADARHQLFTAARVRAEWTVEQLWLGYLAFGGVHDAFELDAHLQGLQPFTPAQQDVLASAVNDRLEELYLGARVPYLSDLSSTHPGEDPLDVHDELRGLPPPGD